MSLPTPRGTASASLTQNAYERLRADLLACRHAPRARRGLNAPCAPRTLTRGAGPASTR